MSIFFLNSTNRIYNDKEINKIPQLLFSSGVFNTQSATQALWRDGGDFFVDADGSTLNISAKKGSASLRVTSGGVQQQVVIQEDNALVASVAPNSTLAVRNDAVVLRVNQSIITNDQLNAGGSNAVSLVVISGNSATPLTEAEISVALSGDPFVLLANIAVPLSASAITQDMITDVRTIVKMTRTVKLASDRLRLYGLENDPDILEQGDIWFNTREGILKMYDGENSISLQTQAFDWGYYPPNGVDYKVDSTEAFVENVGGVGESDQQVYYLIDNLGGSYTVMQAQVFKMPNIANPFLRVKMGNPEYQSNIAFKVYSVNGSNQPATLIETPLTLSANDVPKNDYVNIYLDGSLYTPGQNYIIVFQSTQLGVVNGADSQFIVGAVKRSTYTDDSGYLIGTRNGFIASLTTNPLSITWSGSVSTSTQWVMSIAEREELEFGKTDSTGNVHKLSQMFVPKSRDIIGFRVVKGAENGNPTDDINAYLYLANDNNEPTGNVLTSATITEQDWLEGGSGTEKEFTLGYDNLIVGQKYVVVLECETYSDTDNYTVYFGVSADGGAKRWTTANGWVNLDGNLFFATVTSPNRKIVVTNDQGKIPVNLFNENELIDLLPFPAFHQEFMISGSESLTTDEDTHFGSNEDGSVLYLFNGNSAGSGRGLYRFERDPNSGMYFQTHRINNPTLTPPNGDNGAIVVLGDYIYVFTNNGTNVVCSRFLAANLTDETAMTVPTLACTTHVMAWTDGENIHVVSAQSSTTSNRWTIAGTVMSSSTTATVSSNLVGANKSSVYDGEYVYVFSQSNSTQSIYKLTASDGSAMETTTKEWAVSRYSDNYSGGFIAPVGTDRLYIGFEYTWWNELNADVSKGIMIVLIPITKP